MTAVGLAVQSRETKDLGICSPLPFSLTLSRLCSARAAQLEEQVPCDGGGQPLPPEQLRILLVKIVYLAQTWVFLFLEVQINIKHHLI